MPPPIRRLPLVLAVALCVCAPCGGLAQEKPGALEQLNDQFRDAYRRARADLLAQAGPVVIVDFDHLTLLRGKEREEIALDFSRYHHLKAVAHAPFGLYLEVATQPDGPLSAPARAKLAAWSQALEKAEAALPKYGFGKAQGRQQQILRRCVKFVDATVEAGRLDLPGVQVFARSLAPLFQQNLDDAARVQIDAYHAQVVKWRRQLTAEQWGKLRVIVMGSQLPRKDNIAVQYFAKWLGQAGESRRLIYSEAIYDEQKALNLLGSHMLDRRAAEAFFADPTHLHRDLLADSAAAYLKTLKFADE